MKKEHLSNKGGLPSEVKKTIIIIVIALFLLVGMYFLTKVILNNYVE